MSPIVNRLFLVLLTALALLYGVMATIHKARATGLAHVSAMARGASGLPLLIADDIPDRIKRLCKRKCGDGKACNYDACIAEETEGDPDAPPRRKPVLIADTADSCRDYLQDREVAETPEQQRDYDACLARVRKPVAVWRPWQEIWQCNDIRLTVTSRREGVIEYDIGGSIWGGSRFVVDFRRSPQPAYWFNDRPCMRYQ
jgi:hypothetical protein